MKLLPSMRCVGSLCIGLLTSGTVGFFLLTGQIIIFERSHEELLTTIRGVLKGGLGGIITFYFLWVLWLRKLE